MKALFLRDHFQPHYALLLADLQPPCAPTSTQVHIKVLASSVSRLDPPLCAIPADFPASSISGRELSGVVLYTGNCVTHVKAGDRVAAVLHSGAWAEELVVDAAFVVKLPHALHLQEASCALGSVLRAIEAVHKAAVGKGERVLVGGAATSDGVALAAVLRALVGARVVGVVKGGDALNVAKKSCAEVVVDRSVCSVGEMLEGEKVRVAFDCAGEGKRIGDVVKKGGVVVRVGEGTCAKGGVPKGVNELMAHMHISPDKIVAAADFIAKFGIRVPYGPTFGVKEYVRALTSAEEGVQAGKVVVLF